MLNSRKPTTTAAREVSPITQPPSLVPTKPETVEMTSTTTTSEPERILSVPTKQEDSAPSVEFGNEGSVSTSSPTAAEAAGTTADIDTTGEIGVTGDVTTTNVHTRCVSNFLKPDPEGCRSQITDDDRHYISNFFGRNKSCSTSIPDEFYQVLCRRCMQTMKYRLKNGDGASEIEVQVSAIKHALGNMAASGRWALLEVQLTKSEFDRRQNPEKYTESIKKFNDDVTKSREEAKQKGEKARRRNTKKPMVPVPDWLMELVVKVDDKYGGNGKDADYTPIHERHPTRWTFEDLIALVDMIGENCEVLPNIECLPITQGELDKVDFEDAHRYRKEAKRELQILDTDIAKLKGRLQKEPKNKQHQDDLETFQQAKAAFQLMFEDAEKQIERTAKIQEASAHTLPPKRVQLNKSGTKPSGSKTVTKKGVKKAKARERDSEETIIDPDAQPEARADPQPDVKIAGGDDDDDDDNHTVRSPSPSPSPGWKGKAKARAVSTPKTSASKGQGRAKAKPRKSSITNAAPPAATSRSQIQAKPPGAAAAAAASVTAPAVTAAPTRPFTPPPPSTVPPPTTPDQATSASPSTKTTSTTRSAGRKLQLAAGRQQQQQARAQTQDQGQAQPQTLTPVRVVKREAGDELEEEREGEGEVVERGSPEAKGMGRKKVKRSASL